MSTVTPNLGLFKYNTTSDSNIAFNINTALNNNWDKIDAAINGGSSRNIGEIVASTIPLTDAGLHLLDGALIQGGGIYSVFVDYVSDLYNDTKVYNHSAFTVVGSPTISSDGVANGFSSGNYLKMQTPIAPVNSLYITFEVDMPSNAITHTNEILTRQNNGGGFWFQLNYNSNGSYYQLALGNSTNADITGWANIGAIDYGKKVLFNLTWNGNVYKFKKSLDNGETFTELGSWNSTLPIGTDIYNIGKNGGELTSIDLKQFSITADGVEVCSGSNPSQFFTAESEWQASISQYGVCGKFVYNSTNNTVRLPKVNGIIEGTTDLNALGDLVEAGLPNIIGTFKADCGYTQSSGAIYETSYTHSSTSGGGAWHSSIYGLDASRSSSIYGNSSTVQPQTIKAFYYIVIATTTKIDIQVDIDEIATDLNGKADTDLSNVPNSKGILTESYINGTSWYRVYSDRWCEQGGTANASMQSTDNSITLLKRYDSTSYYANGNCGNQHHVTMYAYSPAEIHFGLITANVAWGTGGVSWYACGYIN